MNNTYDGWTVYSKRVNSYNPYTGLSVNKTKYLIMNDGITKGSTDCLVKAQIFCYNLNNK